MTQAYAQDVPDAVCPTCHRASPKQDWTTPAMFSIRCPACGSDADIADVELRLTVTPPRKPPPSSEPHGDEDFDLW
jgi:Zn ribbon nucleic-acid-binding protein